MDTVQMGDADQALTGEDRTPPRNRGAIRSMLSGVEQTMAPSDDSLSQHLNV